MSWFWVVLAISGWLVAAWCAFAWRWVERERRDTVADLYRAQEGRTDAIRRAHDSMDLLKTVVGERDMARVELEQWIKRAERETASSVRLADKLMRVRRELDRE